MITKLLKQILINQTWILRILSDPLFRNFIGFTESVQNSEKLIQDVYDTTTLKGISLHKKADGYWLSFRCQNGNRANLRIESLEDKFGYVTWKAIIQWAEENC